MDLTLTLSQKLALSQRMLLSAEILQMSSLELVEYMKELAVENPVVEYEEARPAPPDLLQKKLDWLAADDEQNKYYYRQEKSEHEGEDWNFRELAGESLEEHLRAQLAMLTLPPPKRALVEYLIESLDANGYLDEEPSEMARRLHTPERQVAEALRILQGMDPMGVGARDLPDCLRIQARRLGVENPLVLRIIDTELPTLAKNQMRTIAKHLKVSLEEVIDAVSLIRTLNPRPGNSFASSHTLEYIVPDVLVYETKDGFEVVLNNAFFPRLTISPYYRDIIKDEKAEDAREYVCDKIRQAEWAMKCISKRNSTLQKTLEVILDLQREFFEQGPGHLRPMRLYDVAGCIAMHESTVSRAIRDKYLQCKWGVFPLSAFFPIGVAARPLPQAGREGGEVTPEYIKARLRELLEQEDKTAPLSDRVLTERLNSQGIDISRRTVAKYREAMGYPGIGGRRAY